MEFHSLFRQNQGSPPALFRQDQGSPPIPVLTQSGPNKGSHGKRRLHKSELKPSRTTMTQNPQVTPSPKTTTDMPPWTIHLWRINPPWKQLMKTKTFQNTFANPNGSLVTPIQTTSPWISPLRTCAPKTRPIPQGFHRNR